MSEKQFETFLTEQFTSWASTKLNPGYRYQFQSPDSNNSNRLYGAFVSLSSESIEIKNVSLPVVNCEGTKLLVVLHSEGNGGFSENFISHIRDEVAGQQLELKNSSLLVIHNSMLDTLINSAENVAQIGWVWHPAEIKKAMFSLIDEHDSKRKVSECLLEHRFNQIDDDGATMFGFEDLFKAIVDDGDLRFDEIGLLNDPALEKWDGPVGQINHRLEENKKLYERIEHITHHFPNSLDEKLTELDFGESFIKKHFKGEDSDAWKTELELSACEQEQKKNKENLLELEKETISHGTLFVKNKAETKAGQRERHLIILLDEEQDDFEFELTFVGGKLEKKQCAIKDNKEDEISFSSPDNTGGKRSRISVFGAYLNKATYFSFIVKRDKAAERFKFRVLVLRKGEFFEDAFKFNYLIEPNKKRITLQTEENSLVIAEAGGRATLEQSGQVFDNTSISEVDFEQLANESDQLDFIVKSKTTELCFNVEGAIATDSLSLPLILDQDRFVRLYQDDYFGSFNRSKNKVLIDNKEIAPKGRRLTLLQWEAQLLDQQFLTRKDNDTFSLKLMDIEGNYPDLYLAYKDFFELLIAKKTLPSINGWGEVFCQSVNNVVKEYNLAINEIKFDSLLSKHQKQLVNIGFAEYDGVEYITPFHPLVLSYYLNLVETINSEEGDSFKGLPKVTVARLNAQGLLPFVYHPIHEFSYNQIEQENCFWLQLVPQKDTSYDYVRKLVKDKVTEFCDAFSALFTSGHRSSLIINSVNNHHNKELFLGLIDFVKVRKDKVCQIHVNLYDDELTYCEFDRFADTHSYDLLKELYGLDKGAIREQADAIIDLLRTRLTYSKFKHRNSDEEEFEEQEYAHMSFFRNNDRVQPTDVNVNEELSGVVCHGLLAGEAADNKDGEGYFTAFGLKGVNTDEKPHLKMAEKLSGLIKPSRKTNEQHSRSKAIALAVSDKFKQLLECSYRSSIWTTIIDPKVTLDFFESEKDVVLIHYSDNYTNSVNYDAITVTQETDLYKKVLEQDEGGIIEEFNAFNGEWLLKMITANDNDRKEKKGIIGAYKFVNCLLAQSDITWVPLSVAEMIRVAGNIGLKMSDSDFSRNVHGYRNGAISDDVLFVGFKDKQMILLPLEVKTGKKQTHSKGVEQAKELKRYLTQDILGNNTLASHLYRGLFIRQILMQIDKYKLYHLYDKNYFDGLLAEREWWLQGDYKLAEIAEYPDGFLVSHVENETFFEADFKEVDDILKIQLPISYLPGFIKTPLGDLFRDIKPEKLCHIPEKYILPKEPLLTSAISTEIDNTVVELPTVDYKEAGHVPQLAEVAEPAKTELIVKSNEPLTVLVGNNIQNDEDVLWEPTNTAKFMNTNSGIIGTMGTGKTQCTKSVITQLYRNQHNNVDGKPIGVLIFDYKSDYVDDKFTQATNAKKFKLFKLPYNPLSLFGDTPMLPIHTATGFSETMAKAYALGKKQQLKLENIILDAYELAGIKPEDPSTWKRPAPTIENIWDLFLDQEKVEEDSLYAALSKLARFKIFETDPEKMMSLYELVDGVTVIELAGYPTEVQNLIVALTLDLFYSQMQKQGKPEVQGDFRQVSKLILVDEADNFMSQNFSSLRRILKEGREYGVGVILSTQDITHFKTNENDYSAYILSWIVHRVSQIKNQDIKSIFNKDDKVDQEQLMKSIRGLDKHYSLYVNGDKKITKIKDKAFWEL
tara:strand:+ start:11624 stop:16717 length:5094 start_codon:yes stop_codon:yes gene_type:complete